MLEKLLGLPIDASSHGWQIDRLIFWVHVLMGVLFVGWIAFFLYTLVRFRKGRQSKADYVGVTTHASSYIEAGVAVLEIALLIGISIPFWAWKVSAFPAGPDAVHIRVIGQQFAWNVHYPGPDGKFGRTDIALVNEQTNPIGLDRTDPAAKDDVTTVNQLHVPVSTPIVIELTTKDVIHSFFLPLMRVKQDTVPGMLIPVHFVATKTSDEIREELAKTVTLPTTRKFDGLIAMEDYKDKDGSVLLKKGRSITDAALEKLEGAGVTQIRVGPRYAAEIACAQLCGLGHYRMKGFLTIHDTQGYADWLQEELDNL